MNLVDSNQPYIAVYARTRIPAGGRLQRMIYPNCNHIGLFKLQMPGKVVLKCGVSVRVSLQKMPIDIHVGIHLNSVKLYHNPFIFHRIGQYKRFAVPAFNTRQKCPESDSRILASNFPSTPQSCGRFYVRQATSSKSTVSKPALSSSTNFQLLLNFVFDRSLVFRQRIVQKGALEKGATALN